jgi:STAS-like domain of unknown function (DUF4325)
MEAIKLIDIIKSEFATSPKKGLLAYDFVADIISSNKDVLVSFDGIEDCTTAFCNAFIGKIYMDFDIEKINTLLHIKDLPSNSIWEKKIKNAILLGSNENARAERIANLEELIAY